MTGFGSVNEAVWILVRLVTAMIAGSVAGIEREQMGKAAGLRTHMLVATGSALFVLAAQLSGPGADLSNVIQGICTGIGFVGAGAILKSTSDQQVRGLTTAAGIWMTAAAGIAAGMGQIALALIASVLTLLILRLFSQAEAWIDRRHT